MDKYSKDKAPPASALRREIFERLLAGRDVVLPSLPAIPQRNSEAPAPASPVQKRLWDEWATGHSPESQCETIVLRLTGPANIPTIMGAVNEIVRRHQILRGSFVETGGELYQTFAQNMVVRPTLADLVLLSPDDCEAEWRRLCEAEMGSQFDLRRLPLMRWLIAHLSPEDHRIVVTLHRTICDGWSADIIVDEVCKLYDLYSMGGPDQLDEPALQYSDYIAWQQARFEAGDFDPVLEFWRRQFAEEVRPGRRTDTRRPADRHSVRQTWPIRLSREVSRRIGRFCSREGLTPYIFFVACCNILLGRRMGFGEVSIGTVSANRNHAELQLMIGPLSDILMIKVDVSGNPSFDDVISRSKQAAISAYEHQGLPYERVLAEALQSGRAGIPDMIFILKEGAYRQYDSGALKIVRERIVDRIETSNLSIEMWDRDGDFEGEVDCMDYTAQFGRAERIAAEFERLVHSCLSDTQRRIGDLKPLSH